MQMELKKKDELISQLKGEKCGNPSKRVIRPSLDDEIQPVQVCFFSLYPPPPPHLLPISPLSSFLSSLSLIKTCQGKVRV